MKFEKIEIIKAFVNHFEHELALLSESAKAAHEAATHEESKSEDKHDTRAIEASYLAKGQAKRVSELEEALREFKKYQEHFRTETEVTPGSLLCLELDEKDSHSFFAKNSGGTQVRIQNQAVTIVTEASPLGQMLVGAKIGEAIEVETKSGLKTYCLKTIA